MPGTAKVTALNNNKHGDGGRIFLQCFHTLRPGFFHAECMSEHVVKLRRTSGGWSGALAAWINILIKVIYACVFKVIFDLFHYIVSDKKGNPIQDMCTC